MEKKNEAELLKALEACPAVGTLWRHYKGNVYAVSGQAISDSDQAPLVLRRRFVGFKDGIRVVTGPTFARPLSEWHEDTGGGIPRFSPTEGG